MFPTFFVLFCFLGGWAGLGDDVEFLQDLARTYVSFPLLLPFQPSTPLAVLILKSFHFTRFKTVALCSMMVLSMSQEFHQLMS